MANEKTVSVTIVRDYWFEDNVRTPAGEKIDVPLETALDLIESGVAKKTPKEG